MKQCTRKFLVGTAVLLLSLSVGAVGHKLTHAAVNVNRYGIDVFPSRQNHDQFAYQLRHAGHNGRIYYAKRNSKLGRMIFSHGRPKIDYANYLRQHHPRWYRSIVRHLERTPQPRRDRKVHQVKRNSRQRTMHRSSHKARRQSSSQSSRVLPSKFVRSNNRRALRRSGFLDARPLGGDFIFNKYAPNDRRAVVPKRFNGTNWLQGTFGQPNPPAYVYVAKQRGWKLNR